VADWTSPPRNVPGRCQKALREAVLKGRGLTCPPPGSLKQKGDADPRPRRRFTYPRAALCLSVKHNAYSLPAAYSLLTLRLFFGSANSSELAENIG
jgi:hypothetical protein